MKQINNKAIITQENIKNEFALLKVSSYWFTEQIIPINLKILLNAQNIILKKYNLTITNIVDYIEWQIKSKIIPKRYTPNITEVYLYEDYPIKMKIKDNTKSNGWSYGEQKIFKTKEKKENYITEMQNKNFVEVEGYDTPRWLIVEKIIFKESLISLLIQRKLDNDIIDYFREIAQKEEGIPLDVYIDNWAKRLLTESVGLFGSTEHA